MLRQPVGEYIPGIWMTDTDYIGSGEYRRRLPITVFYPADEIGEEIPYISSGYIRQKKEGKLVEDVRTYCYQNVPLSKKKERYPVIVYSHGLDGYRMDSTVLCADLASVGYIIVSVGHPYGAGIVQYTDGTYMEGWRERFGDYPKYSILENLRLFWGICPIRSLKKRMKSWENYTKKNVVIREHLLPLWEEDLIAGMDYVEQMERGEMKSQFQGHMDLSGGIALIGMSLGGNTAIDVSFRDNRVAKAINLDGSLFSSQKEVKNTPDILVYCQKINIFAHLRLRAMKYHKLKVCAISGVQHWQFADGVYLSDRGKQHPEWADRVSKEKFRSCLEFLQNRSSIES